MSASRPGALAIVLHAHMPYVEGFGTWPFGEEWLWEAIAGCYLPLLELLESGAPLTLSVTPVLADQLEAPDLVRRFRRFVEDVRETTHRRDAAGLREGGHEQLAREVERAGSDYRAALESLDRIEASEGLLAAMMRHAAWTSSATHAVLPLLATDAGVRLQVRSGIAAHRRRSRSPWRGGFWLPECAYSPALEPLLAQAGVRAVCVERTAELGLGSWEHLRPAHGAAGVVLVPIDRATISLVWSDRGYPASGPYRDYHHHTTHHHNPWSNDGEPYEHGRAAALAREHAADFVARTIDRLERAAAEAPAGALQDGGLVVCALDSELLGHWWYEGVMWLEGVVAEARDQGLELVRLDDALDRAHGLAPTVDIGERGLDGEAPPASWRASSWGQDGDLSTWSGPAVAEMAFAARDGELAVLAAGPAAGERAVRELLALQASDWPFMVSREIAVPYARERFDGHRAALEATLRAGAGAEPETAIRNLAVDAEPSALLS